MNKQQIEYLLTAKLATFGFDVTIQALHAKNNGALTYKELGSILEVMQRVHTKYSLQLEEQRKAILRRRNASRAIIFTVLASFSLAAILSTLIMWSVYG